VGELVVGELCVGDLGVGEFTAKIQLRRLYK
jgi:hypothetical protein